MNIDVLNSFTPEKKHDIYAVETIKEAILAAENGNFGVGCVLVDNNTGEIVCRGHNAVFSDSRSDMHAEMAVLNKFEEQYGEKSREMLNHMSLFTSLESCPMCLCRLLTAGVMEIYHLADDEGGGMVHLMDNLPPVWQSIAKGRVIEKADCSEVLRKYATELFDSTEGLDNKLMVSKDNISD